MKTSAFIALIAGLFLALLTFAAPAADAQGPQYAAPYEMPSTDTCAAGYIDLGPIVTPGPFWHTCVPSGYNQPITTAAECAAANAVSSNSYWYFARLINHNGGDLCVWHSWPLPGSGMACGAGWIQAQDSGGNQYCHLPAYARGGGTGAGIRASTPACIESSVVQTNAAKTLGVGSNFVSDGTVYHIITGSATCEFNCHRGFDANCDDRLGDYCSVELNLSIVGDVGKCLEALGIEIE